jgi:hypothetical protein
MSPSNRPLLASGEYDLDNVTTLEMAKTAMPSVPR